MRVLYKRKSHKIPSYKKNRNHFFPNELRALYSLCKRNLSSKLIWHKLFTKFRVMWKCLKLKYYFSSIFSLFWKKFQFFSSKNTNFNLKLLYNCKASLYHVLNWKALLYLVIKILVLCWKKKYWHFLISHAMYFI